jgi:hypothetical protein
MPLEPLAITAGAWAWDKYGKSLTDKVASAVRGRWDKFGWDDAAEKYREKIIKLYGMMQIMGMPEPVPLDDIFTDAYMLDRPTAFGRFDIEQLKQLSADPASSPPPAERINGLRLVVEKGNLFILGGPGAGKTTFLKYIAVKAAEQTIDKVPVFVSLKEWADSGSELLPFVLGRFDICDFPDARPFVEELLKSGSAIVLFDGLDEVNQESGQRDTQTRAMNNFIEKYDRTQCLITCRVAASDYSFQPFIYVEIAEFSDKQIETFVGNWFRKEKNKFLWFGRKVEKDKETCDKFLSELKSDDNVGLRYLARTPLLLTLLCLAYDETRSFPHRRVEVYEEALDALLKKWDSSRRIQRGEMYRKLSRGNKENMLARIAAETFEANEYFIPQRRLEGLITDYLKSVPPHDENDPADGEAILKAIESQHGVFVERAREVYSFSHLTFQEYFTAKYIVATASKGTLTSLVREHCADGRWREVFLLTTSLLPEAGHFIKTFRRFVDEFLGGDEKFRSLLEWADERARLTQLDPWLVRSGYLWIGLRQCGRTDHSDSFKGLRRPHDSADNLNLDFHLVGTFDAVRYLTRALTRILDDRLTLNFDLTREQHDAHKVLQNITNNHRRVRTFINELGLSESAKELTEFSLPTYAEELKIVELSDADTFPAPIEQATVEEWYEFGNKLLQLMRHRDIAREYDLTGTQEEQFAKYLNATILLRDCLQLAYMPPDEKKAILDSLYLPPAHAGEGLRT